MGIADHWSADLVGWARRKFSIDLAGREVYFVSDVEAGPSFHVPGAAAWVGVGLDQRLQPRLEELGLWQGPGDVVVVQAGWSQQSADGELGTLVHELAHAIQFREETLSPAEVAAFREVDQRRNDQARRGETVRFSAPSVPWELHEADWIRAALHPARRAGVPEFLIGFAGPRYGLSGGEEYIKALGDEPQRLAGLPVAEILKTPAPAAFDDLFAADVARFKASQAV